MIAAATDSDGEVSIYVDRHGRDELIKLLNSLEPPDHGQAKEHFHLLSLEWGNGALSLIKNEVLERADMQPVHHLKVLFRNTADFQEEAES